MIKNLFICTRFPETNEFIDSTLKEECEKEKITAHEVIFCKFKSKKLAQINISCLQIWKGLMDNKRAKPLSKKEIKTKVLDYNLTI